MVFGIISVIGDIGQACIAPVELTGGGGIFAIARYADGRCLSRRRNPWCDRTF